MIHMYIGVGRFREAGVLVSTSPTVSYIVTYYVGTGRCIGM